MKRQVMSDLSTLPETGFGSRTLAWWGVLGFILIEGAAFVLAAGAYLYIMGQTSPWPPHNPPPSLWLGTSVTILLLLSEIANTWTDRAAHALNVRATRIGFVVMSLVGVVLIGLRLVEFDFLNVRWDDSAYGSIVWALLLIHAVHVITDVADTIVFAAFLFSHNVGPKQMSDASDNCFYWHFVVLAWLPIYGLIYWAPRLVS
jgi:cytochrome c oxidase subunit III